MAVELREYYQRISSAFPSREEFDKKKYTKRDYYEQEYVKALSRSKCILVRGSSGSGKSWLTKYILDEEKIKYETINLAHVAIVGSFIEFFKTELGKLKIEYTEEKEINANSVIASSSLMTSNSYQLTYNYFFEYIKHRKNMYIILENIESTTNYPSIIKEIGALITLVDDPEVQACKTKFILIGTNSVIKNFYDDLPNGDTIANRIIELPEIRGFNSYECYQHISKSFKHIGIKIKNELEFSEYVRRCTNGIPQNVNDFCSQISYVCVESGEKIIEDIPTNQNDVLVEAQRRWVKESFMVYYSQISNLYRDNLKQESNKRNNYILYMLHEIDKYEFDVDKFKASISSYFPRQDEKLGKQAIKKYLDKLSDTSNNNNILVKQRPDFYSIRNYKFVLCIRMMMYMNDDEVCIYDLAEIPS